MTRHRTELRRFAPVMERLYLEEGLSLTEIGRRYGCTGSAVMYQLERMPTDRQGLLKWAPEMEHLYLVEGLSLTAIAERFECTVSTVHRLVRELDGPSNVCNDCGAPLGAWRERCRTCQRRHAAQHERERRAAEAAARVLHCEDCGVEVRARHRLCEDCKRKRWEQKHPRKPIQCRVCDDQCVSGMERSTKLCDLCRRERVDVKTGIREIRVARPIVDNVEAWQNLLVWWAPGYKTDEYPGTEREEYEAANRRLRPRAGRAARELPADFTPPFEALIDVA